MSGFPTANFAESAIGLFSTEEIQRLMRVEYERALRYDYPVVLLFIEVDRLEYLHDLYGYESKEEILHAVISLLRSITRASDFLGCMMDDRILALLPHTSQRAASALAGRLLRGGRKLHFESDGRSLQATLSIGMSLAQGGDEPDFDGFLSAATDGLRFAAAQGGDRYVVRETAKELIEELRQDLDAEAKTLMAEQAQLQALVEEQATELARRGAEPPTIISTPEVAQPEPVAPVIRDLPENFLTDQIREVFEGLDPEFVDLRGLEREITELVETGVQIARDDAVAEHVADHARRVDLLERRVTKLRDLLDTTESELTRIAKMKNVDLGVASIYRSVQGLSNEDAQFEKKREMLSILFEANVELRRQLREREEPEGES